MPDIDETYQDYYGGPVSDHFDGVRFFNPWARRQKKSLIDMLRWRFNGQRAMWPDAVLNDPRPPIEKRLPEQAVRITYLGHATLLIQIGGLNILTDPVFSERASPFSAIGPKRVRPPFLALNDLPPIDAVFVSHNHYDHLDQMSLNWLARNSSPLILTPLGNPRLIKSCAGGCRIVALDWHDHFRLANGVTLTLVPVQHWSRRGLSDINRDLWGGCWLTDESRQSAFYCADSGFHEGLFIGLRKRYGRPDLAALPVGAYEPRWFMRYSHMNPEEAIELHRILSPKKSIGFHHETFQLTDEAFETPRKATYEALERAGLQRDDFLVPVPGDFIAL